MVLQYDKVCDLCKEIDELRAANRDVLRIYLDFVIRKYEPENVDDMTRRVPYVNECMDDIAFPDDGEVVMMDIKIKSPSGRLLATMSSIKSIVDYDAFIKTLRMCVFKSSILMTKEGDSDD